MPDDTGEVEGYSCYPKINHVTAPLATERPAAGLETEIP